MAFTRIYTGADGKSHMEVLDLTSAPDWTKMQDATGVQFRVDQPGRFSDWHQAPRRQFVITLEGEGEIGLGDGTVHRFGPGNINLVEDVTGEGHTTRVVSDIPRVTVTIPLADQTPGG
ncbi:MAG: hypothetical protein ACE5Q6_05210 [Dehalococcoidia bacterium]